MRLSPLLLATAALLVGCGSRGDAESAAAPAPAAGASVQAPITGPQRGAAKPFDATPVAKFAAPWAMTFLPDGRMLVTEKAGQMLLVSADGKTRRTVTTIAAVDSAGQGGLMDVVLHPGFPQNRLVYFSYSTAGQGGKGVVLARGRLAGKPGAETLDGIETIFRASPLVEGNGHYSGRIAFAPDGKLFFTNGERQQFDPAQDPRVTLGKVLRLNDDGTPAADNPLSAKGFHPAVWSYGHRNLLGIAFDAKGRLWEQEMGPKGGDEVNLILPGRNYGYPIVSNGDHYDGRVIPDHSTQPEFEAPKVSWNPVISPAGLMFYSGALFPAWQGSAFIGGLSSKALVRIAFDGDTAREAERFDMGARIREVEQGPDGALWVLEDGESGGRLLRLMPKPG
ncbi:PQQ-dependent sugar dehydrogenase [Sphingomonas solaris]|uniref:PQQ-dependent sugar dehydrogenase n=1 Tax=Alterirhizorhabdus solaris TaxID=2529389 RepID=A0A558R7H0_9SPHN|nr:PQQ-dependent sugar dehydrogenase [Sphingomonas solaris]TVV75268.1 PQQ-dependent sugar dehydrogenase [Sphingomonas solaris]